VQGPQGEGPISGRRTTPGREPPQEQVAQQDPNPDQPAPGQGQGRRGRRGGGARGGGTDGAGASEEAPFEMPSDNLNYPFGEYGFTELPKQQSVLLTNATIWTSGPDGIIESGWMLVRDGKIAQIGDGNGWEVVHNDSITHLDCAGKHITPGLIDCHSHTGIDGGVNEGTQANTAEVRIGECIDPDDINWYRQLAGGLTACNQLHGSANPIGGQNSVVKLKWGQPASAFPIDGAIPGIKFALGENVKRSTTRYPNTRMGVETFIRDAFTAARDYKNAWAAYNNLSADQKSRAVPPRRDLEMDTLVEILDGKRIVHCHSYRQDEILMLIRVADEFGFTIGTFQHVLEGYKIADAIAKHGAGASSFSDWWAYKIEVIDAIPYNGSLMDQVGVLVSFNSDSDELARRMNWEASKAVRYGGLSPGEALKFVTINPAKQLRIDNRTGSLEHGKDADFVIWSGDPLSTYSQCEQTWIEGAKYFDIGDDLKMRDDVDRERQRLIQKILRQSNGEPAKAQAATQTAPDSQPASKPGTLLARMLRQHENWVDEQLRQGLDPDENRPGSCGCDTIDMIYNNYGAEQ
jgi:N-acetylglucosamine-6-phosphate deacetylase